MKLQNLLTDFNSLSGQDQASFFNTYYEKRRINLLSPPTPVKIKRTKTGSRKKSKDKLISVSLNQFMALKKLGLVK